MQKQERERRKEFHEFHEFKKEIGVQWVKGRSGNTYLCPTSALGRVDKNNEAELQKICIDESDNPQNN